MRTLSRKLVVTPLLMGMALMALGIPASAQAVYQQNSSQARCQAAGSDQSQCTAESETECKGQSCVPAQICRPGPQSAPGCCPQTETRVAQI
jgi:hypothetical protein